MWNDLLFTLEIYISIVHEKRTHTFKFENSVFTILPSPIDPIWQEQHNTTLHKNRKESGDEVTIITEA